MRRITALLFLTIALMMGTAVHAQGEQTPYEIALARILEAEATGATELNLTFLHLTDLPPEIGNLTNLILPIPLK